MYSTVMMNNKVPFNVLKPARRIPSTANDESQEFGTDSQHPSAVDWMELSASANRFDLQQAASSLEHTSSQELLYSTDQRRRMSPTCNTQSASHVMYDPHYSGVYGNGNGGGGVSTQQHYSNNHHGSCGYQKRNLARSNAHYRNTSTYNDGPASYDRYSNSATKNVMDFNYTNSPNTGNDFVMTMNERVLRDIQSRNQDGRSASMYHRDRPLFGDCFNQVLEHAQHVKIQQKTKHMSGSSYFDTQYSAGRFMTPDPLAHSSNSNTIYLASGSGNRHEVLGPRLNTPMSIYPSRPNEYSAATTAAPNNTPYGNDIFERYKMNYTTSVLNRHYSEFDYHQMKNCINYVPQAIKHRQNNRQQVQQSKNSRVFANPNSKSDGPASVTNRGFYIKFLFNKCVVADIQSSMKKLFQFLKKHSFGFAIGDQYKNIGDRWCILTHSDKNILITGIFLMVHYCRRKFLKKRGIVDKKIKCEAKGDRKLQHSYTKTTFKFLCDTEVDKVHTLRASLNKLIDGLSSCEQLQESTQTNEGGICSDYNVIAPSIDTFDGMYAAVRTYRKALDLEPGHIDRIMSRNGLIEDTCLRCFIGEEPTDGNEYLCGIVSAVKAMPETTMSVVDKICNLIITANYEVNIYPIGSEIPVYRKPTTTTTGSDECHVQPSQNQPSHKVKSASGSSNRSARLGSAPSNNGNQIYNNIESTASAATTTVTNITSRELFRITSDTNDPLALTATSYGGNDDSSPILSMSSSLTDLIPINPLDLSIDLGFDEEDNYDDSESSSTKSLDKPPPIRF